MAAAKAETQAGWDEAYVLSGSMLRDLEQARNAVAQLVGRATELMKTLDAQVVALRPHHAYAKRRFDEAEDAWVEAETASRELRARHGLGYRDDGTPAEEQSHVPKKKPAGEVRP